MGSLDFIKMKKIFKNVLLVFVFFVLAGAMVYSADIDKIKIEKINLDDGTTQYYIYRLSEVITDKKIDEDKLKLEKKLLEIEVELESDFEDCIYCLPEFEEGYWKSIEECEKECNEVGSYLTAGRKYQLVENKELLLIEKERLDNLI